jgi:hypothetical protein
LARQARAQHHVGRSHHETNCCSSNGSRNADAGPSAPRRGQPFPEPRGSSSSRRVRARIHLQLLRNPKQVTTTKYPQTLQITDRTLLRHRLLRTRRAHHGHQHPWILKKRLQPLSVYNHLNNRWKRCSAPGWPQCSTGGATNAHQVSSYAVTFRASSVSHQGSYRPDSQCDTQLRKQHSRDRFIK